MKDFAAQTSQAYFSTNELFQNWERIKLEFSASVCFQKLIRRWREFSVSIKSWFLLVFFQNGKLLYNLNEFWAGIASCIAKVWMEWIKTWNNVLLSTLKRLLRSTLFWDLAIQLTTLAACRPVRSLWMWRFSALQPNRKTAHGAHSSAAPGERGTRKNDPLGPHSEAREWDRFREEVGSGDEEEPSRWDFHLRVGNLRGSLLVWEIK